MFKSRIDVSTREARNVAAYNLRFASAVVGQIEDTLGEPTPADSTSMAYMRGKIAQEAYHADAAINRLLALLEACRLIDSPEVVESRPYLQPWRPGPEGDR